MTHKLMVPINWIRRQRAVLASVAVKAARVVAAVVAAAPKNRPTNIAFNK